MRHSRLAKMMMLMGGGSDGREELPDAAFSFLPFGIWDDGDGTFSIGNWDISAQVPRTGGDIYVAKTGNDTTGNGTQELPYLTIGKAFAVAYTNKVIHVGAGRYGWSDGGSNSVSVANNVSLVGTGVVELDSYVAVSWTLTAEKTNTYQSAWTLPAARVLDYGSKDAYGVPTSYTGVANVDAVEATAGTYFVDDPNNLIYVHALEGGSPDADIRPQYLGSSLYRVTTGTPSVYIENIRNFCGSVGSVSLAPSAAASYYFKDCLFARSLATANGIINATANAIVYAQGCKYLYSATDGMFGNGSIVVEIDCEGAYNGVTGGADSWNGSTNHNAGKNVAIGCNFHHNYGPNSANINTCVTWALGCTFSDSAAVTVANNNVGFQNGGSAWLDRCTGANNTYNFSAADGSTIYHRDFTGDLTKVGTGSLAEY